MSQEEMLEETYQSMMGTSARNVLDRAREEAHIREHKLLKPEHLLKAIVELERPLFDQEVRRLKLDPPAVILALDSKLDTPEAIPTGRHIGVKCRVNGDEVPT